MHHASPIFLFLFAEFCQASPNRHQYLSPRQLETLPQIAVTNRSYAPPLSQGTVSKNLVQNEEDDGKYYLGYRAADFARPYAKYWNPNVQPISSEVQKGLSASPWAKPLAGFAPQEAGRLLTQPGYLQMESGWTVSLDGTLTIAVRTEIPEVTGEMIDWWFGWHQVDSARYKLWNPVAHQYAWRFPEQLDWANKSYTERYIGTFSQIDEYLGQDANKFTIAFVDPNELGFDRSKFADHSIETVVVAQIILGRLFSPSIRIAIGLCCAVAREVGSHANSSSQSTGQYVVHQIRRKDDGSREMRSRFFLKVFTPEIAHDLLVHCNIEMQHLNYFLPGLFSEFKDTL
ncbi:hypothetical protein IWZ01DRAFT_485912 [Phyllosticta capitalensis]